MDPFGVPGARPEPYPAGCALRAEHLYKLRSRLPGLKGDVGQGHLLYLVDEEKRVVTLLLVYTHKDHRGRPASRDLRRAIEAARERILARFDGH